VVVLIFKSARGGSVINLSKVAKMGKDVFMAKSYCSCLGEPTFRGRMEAIMGYYKI